jgi:hypothetical protein
MASKYDDFWRGAEVLEKAVSEAALGDKPLIDCSEIRSFSERLSWAGSASVVGARVATSSMAQMVSLGRIVASAEMCVPWPDETFFFTMSIGASLRVRTSSAPTRIPRSADRRSVVERPSLPTQAESEEPSLDAGEACRAIHDALGDLPRYSSPGEVPFTNGLYFFFETGEVSPHGSPRITRIGNHPHVQDRLIGRLQDHYRTRRDAKNGSVFRRYLFGTAIMWTVRGSVLRISPPSGDSPQLAPLAAISPTRSCSSRARPESAGPASSTFHR